MAQATDDLPTDLWRGLNLAKKELATVIDRGDASDAVGPARNIMAAYARHLVRSAADDLEAEPEVPEGDMSLAVANATAEATRTHGNRLAIVVGLSPYWEDGDPSILADHEGDAATYAGTLVGKVAYATFRAALEDELDHRGVPV